MYVPSDNLSMAIQECMLTTVMTVCVEWLAGLVTEMDVYGVVVARLKNTASAQRIKKQQKSKRRKVNFSLSQLTLGKIFLHNYTLIVMQLYTILWSLTEYQ